MKREGGEEGGVEQVYMGRWKLRLCQLHACGRARWDSGRCNGGAGVEQVREEEEKKGGQEG